MSKNQPCKCLKLKPKHTQLLKQLLDCFATVFADTKTYSDHRPSNEQLRQKLSNDNIVVVVALKNDMLMGGLVAYELPKLEQNRSEFYIYDLAVMPDYRRQGVATALIEKLKSIAKKRGAWVIFVQADYGDKPAINLYRKLGNREQVLHFDISLN